MRLLETISVRLFEPGKAQQIQLVFSQIKQGAGGVHLPDEAFLFSSCTVPGDWTMQLTWLGDDLPKAKTALGRQMADTFRSIGLVHHTIWQSFFSGDV